MTSASFGDAELVMAFPTFGAFTVSGTMTYADATHALSGRLLARDDSGTIIGNAFVSVSSSEATKITRSARSEGGRAAWRSRAMAGEPFRVSISDAGGRRSAMATLPFCDGLANVVCFS
jgi:hypothetical protein